MWRAVRSVVPGVSIPKLGFGACDTLGRNKVLQSSEPMLVVSVTNVGVPQRLGSFYLVSQRRGPFVPTEYAASVQCHGHSKGLRFPRLTKHGPILVTRNTGKCAGRLGGSMRIELHQARSRYGSQASTETCRFGSPSLPHNSCPSNFTV